MLSCTSIFKSILLVLVLGITPPILPAQNNPLIFDWDQGDNGEGVWVKHINCGIPSQPGGEDNAQGSTVTFGTTEQVRFPNSHSIKFWTNSNIEETCNQNFTAERAEISSDLNQDLLGLAEGSTVWFGWSEIWTELDESHITTLMQFRSNCDEGSPATQLNIRPDRMLQIKTLNNPQQQDIGIIREHVWYDFVLEIKYSKESDGYIKVWMQAACSQTEFSYASPSAQILNSPTMFPTDDCPEIRWGIYRHGSGDKIPEEILVQDRMMVKYMGPVKTLSGNNLGQTGFEQVRPRAASNLATGKVASQSSTYGQGNAMLANDGNILGSSPWAADLQHTQREVQPWWQVDLGQSEEIESFRIYNRTDAHQGRLKEFYILVSDSPFDPSATLEDHLNDNSIKKRYVEGGAQQVFSIPYEVSGRYVRIQLQGTNILHLAEVEILKCPFEQKFCQGEPPINLALNQPTNQSSTYGRGEGRYANDGIPIGSSPWSADLQHTQRQNQPWWEVDLGKVSQIDYVRIFNRADQYQERLADFYVLTSREPFGNSSLSQLLNSSLVRKFYFSGIAGTQENLWINTRGQYVRIQLTANSNLHISEVEVLGCRTGGFLCQGTNLSNLALGKSAQQSSQYGNGTAAIAVDGDSDGSRGPWSNPSIIHTSRENQPWWQVDLGSVSDIQEVLIHNRSDCCQRRMNDFYLLTSDLPFDLNSSLSTLLNDGDVRKVFFPISIGNFGSVNINTTGRYVRLQLTSPNEILHFAEMEVIGCPNSTANARLSRVDTEETGTFSPQIRLTSQTEIGQMNVTVLNLDPEGRVDYALFNVNGQQLGEESAYATYTFSTNRLSPGIYFLQVRAQDQIWVEKFTVGVP